MSILPILLKYEINPACVYVIINDESQLRIEVMNLMNNSLFSMTKSFAYLFLLKSSPHRIPGAALEYSEDPRDIRRIIDQLVELKIFCEVRSATDGK